MRTFIDAAGDVASADELILAKAIDLAWHLGRGAIRYASLVECRRLGRDETVVFDLLLEVPNRRRFQIQRLERIAATFSENDRAVPRVEVLRGDFPRVPHLNLSAQEVPPSLCLYDEPYHEVKLRWTSARFVRRVREWLELTARGELHPEDQALEPLLVDYVGHIVLPADIFGGASARFVVDGYFHEHKRCFLFVRPRKEGETDAGGLGIVLSLHTCQPRVHGPVHRAPMTIDELASMTEQAGLDLIGELRVRLNDWRATALGARVVMVIAFPKTRVDGGVAEESELWCFATAQTVNDLSFAMGGWGNVNGTAGVLMEPDRNKRGQDSHLLVLNPCSELTRDIAARLNGLGHSNDIGIVGVGAGALGSQVVMNCCRAGFGRWTVIDHDTLMPHNLTRHALVGCLGMNKAHAVAAVGAAITNDQGSCVGLESEIQSGGVHVEKAVATSELVVDMSASVAVQRYLARDVESPARRVCAFMTPSGSDLVIIVEDSGRQVMLDALEMQYYRAMLRDGGLVGHINPSGARQRYGRSCGDTTSDMPQDLVALHAATASRKIKQAIASADAFIGVWRSAEDCSVRLVAVDVCRVTELSRGEWVVVIDDGLRACLTGARQEKLPNETGGVLLGSFDLERKILYIVDALPSPPDSEERRDLYVRGSEGLREAIDVVDQKTGGMLEYVGEWHSHPQGASTVPSDFDIAAFNWLSDLMAMDGLPAVMMIVSDAPKMSLFVGDINKGESLVPGVADELA